MALHEQLLVPPFIQEKAHRSQGGFPPAGPSRSFPALGGLWHRSRPVPRLFIPATRISGGRAELTATEVRHLRALRLGVGSQLTLFDDRDREHDAVICRVGPRAAELEIRQTTTVATEPGPPITLVAAILKGQRMDMLVEKAAELGVARIVPALTQFTVARPAAAETVRTQRWQRLAVSAATQCGRPQVPSVDSPTPYETALRAVAGSALRILFWEEERRTALRALHTAHPAPEALVLAVGPEGGFTRTEVTLAREAGFEVSGLGPRTLRAETAAIAALAMSQATWGDLRG
jgi:16S rRNA (uracil1498-N3)-methyltransferase